MSELSGQSEMDPDLLKQLMERRDEAQRALQDLSDHLKKLNEAINLFQASPTLSGRRGATVHSPTVSLGPARLSPREVGDHARRLLLEAGKPMKRGPLLRLFDQQNIPIVGGDRAKVLGTILWRLKDAEGKPIFVNTNDGYWPADIKLPE